MKINNSKIVLIAQSSNILISLNSEKGYSAKLYRDLACTNCYMSRVLEKFRKAGLITIEKKGRTKSVEMTEKGKRITNHLKKIVRLIK